MLQFTGLQKVGHDLATEQQTTAHINIYYMLHIVYIYIIYKYIFQGVTASNFKFGDDHFKKFVKKKRRRNSCAYSNDMTRKLLFLSIYL